MPSLETTGELPLPPLERVSVLGVPVIDQTMDEALDMLETCMRATPVRSRSVFFVNAATLNVASENPDYRGVLARADFVFGDGTGIRWATRALHGMKLKDNVNGTDLVPELFGKRGGRGYRYFLLGNTPERIERAAKYLQTTYPGFTLAGYHHGYLKPEEQAGVIERINASQAHLLLVGMGNPKQEQWIDAHLHALRVPICMGIGGLTDYFSGDLVRASPWVRRLGQEWLHLLILQPHKARRYLIGNPVFLMRVAKSKVLGTDARKS